MFEGFPTAGGPVHVVIGPAGASRRTTWAPEQIWDEVRRRQQCRCCCFPVPVVAVLSLMRTAPCQVREPSRGFVRLHAERDCRLVVEYVGLSSASSLAGTVRDRFTLAKGLQPPQPVDIDIIKWGDIWSYWDIAADPGYKWPEIGYDADSGKAGVGFHQWTHDRRAQFGFGDDGENTLVTEGAITYFFRKHVQMAEMRCWRNMTLSILRDDGAVIFINGQEALR